ncbi:C2 domain-containing protein [Heterostelium album PN500]|uniref:C2 domain-containing protein n=1 Tax=Heterostelium pallidum (strain ATCC 26659 / Pp 5 / PN500) TaxID=670386 RepID=D3BQH2_HETP5|nr:C2 domain-containing protein [Heterostelium album PN500]EFA76392.1 C2 domain-containing protein [Heterostelium album PN500]|eukprot:XP_020428524.1 C2 domain-containing protein [Heterostelium album PN500]
MNILQVNEARDLVAADTNGFSDPYCVLNLGLQKKKTKTIKRTLNPKWGETFLMRVSPMDLRLHVVLSDWDAMSSDDFLGECYIDLNSMNDQPTWYTLQPRPTHPDDFVKGEVLIKARVVSSMNSGGAREAKLPTNIITEVNNRVTAYETNGELLDLTGIGLEMFPEFLEEHVPDIVNLDLGFNQFKMFPQLKMFKNLQSLSLGGNMIMTIPGDMLDLPLLKTLTINGNQLIAIPPEIKKLVCLEKLDLANNKISVLCEEIGMLSKLEELVIAGNPLQSLPPTFCNLGSLEMLDANGCQLVKLPEEFPQMTRLLELNLGNNKLVELPSLIGRMTRLVVLNIMDNRLTDLPLSIGYCFGLGKIGAGINIEGNPINSDEIISKYKIGNDHLMDHLEKRMAVQGYTLPDQKAKQSNNKALQSSNPTAKNPAGVNNSTTSTTTSTTASSQQQQQQQQPVFPKPMGLVSNKPAPTQPTAAPNAQQDILTKSIALKNWSIAIIRGEIRPKINKVKTQILRCVNIQEGISIANMMKSMKPEIEAIKALIPNAFPTPGVPLSGTSGKIHSGNDKLETLKDLVVASIDDADIVLDSLYQLIPNSSDPHLIVGLVSSLKKIKELLP